MSNAEGRLLWLVPSELEPNPWNPNKMNAFMYAKALESIETHGFVDPVTVRPKGTSYQIIDGEHRWRAAIDLSVSPIPCFDVGPIPDAKAKKLTILLNELRGQAAPDEMGALLKSLMEEEPLERLLEELPYTPDMFRGLTDISTLPELPGRPPASGAELPPEPERRWVERLYRLPLAAAKVLDDAIARAKAGDEIEDWQALERMAADFLAG